MITIWKSVSVFLLAITTLTINQSYINVERDKLNYEVLDVRINNNNIEIEGWATMPHTQHFNGNATHEYALELKSGKETINLNGNITSRNLTTQMAYDGNKKCNAGVMNTINCNFDHKNVGFKFAIPLYLLRENQSYKAYLKMSAKQSKKHYRIPLFYAAENDTYLRKNLLEYVIESDYSHLKFSIFGHTLRARTGPSPKTEVAKGGESCSLAFGNNWYLKQDTVFNNIYDINLYNQQITYFKVRVKPYGCIQDRMRVVESSKGNDTIHVPSTHVNYIGNPMTIHVRKIISKPKLIAEDAYINQYELYDPYRYAKASDKKDGNITDKIHITSNNVNTRIPGIYQTCYEVTNTFNQKDTACAKVTVIKVPSKRRFVSRFTIHDTALRRWSRIDLKNMLNSDHHLIKEILMP